MKDSIYTSEIHQNGFEFDANVASVFEDMIARSVPGYDLSLKLVETITRCHAQAGSRLYDLGCSLGAVTEALKNGSQKQSCSIISVDNSPAMVERCKARFSEPFIDIVCQDVLQTTIDHASVVVLNFVLQFIAMEQRSILLKQIFNGLNEGGVLILSEKIAFDDPCEQQHQIALHETFKLAQGYSSLEISRKRSALEHVLVPESLHTHHDRLKAAGFRQTMTWFQCFNFASIIAYK